MKTTKQNESLKVERVRQLAFLGILIFASLAWSNAEGEQVREMKRRAEALKAEMIPNIRKGLAGLGTTNGVPFLGNNENIQKYWGAALAQATQLSTLVSGIRTQDSSFRMEFEIGWTQGALEHGVRARAKLEGIFQKHAVLDKDEAHVLWSFMYAAHSLAEDVGQPDPFPQSIGAPSHQ